jgi:hypothetical protein
LEQRRLDRQQRVDHGSSMLASIGDRRRQLDFLVSNAAD